MKTPRYYLVTLDDAGAFCTEVTLAREEPEVVVGAMMVHVDREADGDPIDDACHVLREVLEAERDEL